MARSDELIAALGGRTPTDAEATVIENARTAEAQARGDVGRNIKQTAEAERSAAEIIAGGGAKRSDVEVELEEGATKEVDREAIRTQERQKVQEQLDVLDEIFAGEIAREEVAGEERLGRGRAIQARGGLLGSSFGEAQKEKVTEFNRQVIRGVEAEQQQKILGVLDKVDERAEARFQFETSEKRADREAFLDLLATQQEDARADLQLFAGQGIAFDQLAPETQEQLSQQTGWGALTSEIFNKIASGELLTKIEQQLSVGGEISTEDKSFLDAVYGIGFSDKLISVSKAQTEAATEEAQLQSAKDLIDILSKIPEGQIITFGDLEYEGIKETDDGSKIFREVDKKTNKVTFITVSKDGEILNTATSDVEAKETGTGGGGFSTSERKKLEQAGLTDVSREDQLDFLFGTDKEKKDVIERNKTPEEKAEGRDFEATDVTAFIAEEVEFGSSDEEIIEGIMDQFGQPRDAAERILQINK